MSLQLRAYRAADRATVIALWTACGLLRPHHAPQHEIEFVSAATNAELFLAFLGDELAGAVQVGHDGHRAWMYRLGVAPHLHKRGIARALVAHAESWTLARGLPKLMLLIRDGNEPVAEIYRRLGYEQEPRLVMSKSFTGGDHPGEAAMLDVIITYLEMSNPPARPRVPPPAGVKLALLRAEAPSVAFYRFLYDQVGDPWFWYERKELDDQTLGATLLDPAVELYVPYVEGAPAGYAEIDRRSAPEIKLAYFGLIPSQLGRGLGWYFLNWAIDTAWAAGAVRLTVDTCTLDHPKALQTYQRAGFVPYRQEHRRIVDPRLKGLTAMSREPRLP